MPRTRCLWVPDSGAHLISRFVDRRFYLVDDADRKLLMDAIDRANPRWDWRWLSYAAMSSHVHYGLVAGHRDPDSFFRSAHTSFAQQYHARPDRHTLGPVFADRPKIHPIRSAALARLVAYHHRNPVEAGVVRRAADSAWTSHRAYLRLDPAPPWLDVEWALALLNFGDTEAGRRQFDDFVMGVDLDDVRWEPDAEAPAEPSVRRGSIDVDWERLILLAREATGLPKHVPVNSRRRCAVKLRWLVAAIATRDFGQPYAAVASRLGVRTGSVGNLLNRRQCDAGTHDMMTRVRSGLTRATDRARPLLPSAEGMTT